MDEYTHMKEAPAPSLKWRGFATYALAISGMLAILGEPVLSNLINRVSENWSH